MPRELSQSDFPAFFSALWGQEPFAWQSKLAERVMGVAAGEPLRSVAKASWPEVLALPTGSGKTACIDIAVFALAVQGTATMKAVTAPRRIFFVVDRRIIVDEAHDRARRIAQKLTDATDGSLKTVADSLRRLATGGGTPYGDELALAVHALRGGMYRSEGWVWNPLQPTVVASTVDQIGSRLLFRGYGRRSGAWPMAAGLIGNDSLVLLDEVHCAQPFLETLFAVGKYRDWATQPLGRCFHPVVMSATPPVSAADVFRDDSGQGRDSEHPLGRRQLASKRTSLHIADKAKGESGFKELAAELAAAAKRAANGQPRAIVVFANRVGTARETKRLLEPEGEAILLTGRMRTVDRDAVVARLHELRLNSGAAPERLLEQTVFVVATQTLEVGADLDFDALVTECASLDAMRQRFGRLNRTGRVRECRAVVVIRADQAKPKRGEGEDPVYGQALTATWRWLLEHADANDEVDFGIAEMDRLLETEPHAVTKLNAPSRAAPVMLPAHVDCWAQTSPAPRPSPDVAPFLRGPQQGVADVQVCWRVDLDLSRPDDDALESLHLCPPSSVETLPVPIGVFRRWLVANDIEDATADIRHVESEAPSAEVDERADAPNRSVVRWRGRDTQAQDITANPSDIRPGDVLVIPTTHPGAWHQLGDLMPRDDADLAWLDVGDRAHRRARAKPILRLHETLLSAWPDGLVAKGAALELLDDIERRHDDEPDEIADAVGDFLRTLGDATGADMPSDWVWLGDAARELRREYRHPAKLEREIRIVRGPCLVLAGRHRADGWRNDVDLFGDEDDASASGMSYRNGRPVPLRSHLPGVEDFARQHAAGCGLPDDLKDAVACAGLLHDLGKADPRFQALLNGGSTLLPGEVLAKSARMPRSRTARDQARARSRYPTGGRHELLSVRLAESAPALLPANPDLRDLVLHLVESHHGYCRPLAPVVFEEAPVETVFQLGSHRVSWSGPTNLERLDSGVAERYWRLTHRYGWWGLAWLEALLRLADWRRSAWEEAHDSE